MKTIMRKQEVLDGTGFYSLEKSGKFPAKRKLSARSVGWIRQEVDAWINGLELKDASAAHS